VNKKNENIKPGDLVALNEAGEIVKYSNEFKGSPLGIANGGFNIWEEVGVTVYNPRGVVSMSLLECSFCKVDEYTHANQVVDHPFFRNNLEYLEWASEQP